MGCRIGGAKSKETRYSVLKWDPTTYSPEFANEIKSLFANVGLL